MNAIRAGRFGAILLETAAWVLTGGALAAAFNGLWEMVIQLGVIAAACAVALYWNSRSGSRVDKRSR